MCIGFSGEYVDKKKNILLGGTDSDRIHLGSCVTMNGNTFVVRDEFTVRISYKSIWRSWADMDVKETPPWTEIIRV